MSSTNTCTWCVLHKQDWLANYGPRKRNVLFVMIVANILMLIMTWHLPVLIEVLCMYQICVMMTLFAYTLSQPSVMQRAHFIAPCFGQFFSFLDLRRRVNIVARL